MIKVTKVKRVGVADSVEEVTMYKNYLIHTGGYDVDNVAINLNNDGTVGFTLTYKTEEIINLVN